MKQRDRETRERLLQAAAQLFAERGFKKVTVRDICRAARANVAAVNYHFGDKIGLYREVLQRPSTTMRATSEAARAAGEGLSADERLRQYIQVSLCRVMSAGSLSWISSARCTASSSDPTPALDALVEQALRPRVDDLAGMVAEIAPVRRSTTRGCRSASRASTPSGCSSCPIRSRHGVRAKLQLRTDDAATLAEHIATFSLAGIRAMRPETVETDVKRSALIVVSGCSFRHTHYNRGGVMDCR